MSYALLADPSPANVGPARLSRRRLGLIAVFVSTAFAVLAWQRRTLSEIYYRHNRACTAETWSAGRWVRRPIDIPGEIETVEQALGVIGLERCASDLDRDWIFALLPHARLPRKAAMSWRWDAACDERPLHRAQIIHALARDGGLLLIGDSTTERSFGLCPASVTYPDLFFAFSCFLGPDVRFELNQVQSACERASAHVRRPIRTTFEVSPDDDGGIIST